MANKFGIPESEEKKIRDRDKECVYCHKIMIPYTSANHADSATIEHLINVPPWDDSSTVVICCGSCNSSRSNNDLAAWFMFPYCLKNNINENTVAEPVKNFIQRQKIIGKTY